MSDDACCSKQIPRVDVPFRYFTTRLAESMCWGDGFVWYDASMLVIVVMSGRVLCDNQRRLPMMRLICRIVVADAGDVGGLMESTAKPLRYGVGVEFADCRFVVWMRVSMKAGCDIYTERLLLLSRNVSNFIPRK